MSHDIVVQVLVPFLLLAPLGKMKNDNRRSCRGLHHLLSRSFGNLPKTVRIITLT